MPTILDVALVGVARKEPRMIFAVTNTQVERPDGWKIMKSVADIEVLAHIVGIVNTDGTRAAGIKKGAAKRATFQSIAHALAQGVFLTYPKPKSAK